MGIECAPFASLDGGLCMESVPFVSVTQIGRRPRRPRGASVCDGMLSVCGSGGGMGIECALFASLDGGLCIESVPFASITQIGRRPRRPRGTSFCDGKRSVCGSGGGMGIECVPFASLEGVCV